MSAPDRHETAGADADDALRVEFFEAVREILAAAGSERDAASIGGDARPQDEPVRFAATRGARHPDAEVDAVARAGAGDRVAMTVPFMGMTGPAGVLPDHYGDLVVARDRARDEALGAFLDLFNHRALSLFYRAWAKYRLPVRFGETRGSLDDPFSRALAAIAGMSAPGADPRALAAAGPLARRVRSPDALRRIIAALFDLPVTIVELRPRRIRIAPDERTRLNMAHAPNGRFAGLAAAAVVGESAVDVGGRFRVRVGPLDRAQFDAFFAPDGAHATLTAIVRRAVGPAVDFDLQLVLRREAVPPTRVSDPAAPARLGQTSWLLHGPADADRDDAVLPGRALDAVG